MSTEKKNEKWKIFSRGGNIGDEEMFAQ